MDLTREKIIRTIITILKEIQQDVIEEPERISEKTEPIGNLSDFDSLTSVEATVKILVKLGFEINDEFPSCQSLFIEQQKALNVGQVADRILRLNSKRS